MTDVELSGIQVRLHMLAGNTVFLGVLDAGIRYPTSPLSTGDVSLGVVLEPPALELQESEDSGRNV